jgi:hypothetical protein
MEELRAAVIEKTETAPKRAQARPFFNRIQITVLAALLACAVGIYGVLMLSFARPKQVSAAVAAGLVEVKKLELERAHERADAWAARWRSDAQLVGAVARWQLTSGEELTPHRPSWSFSYYSPAAGQVQTLTVDQAGVQPVRQVPVRKAPVPVDADWRLDSDELLFTFLAYGGEEFLDEHAAANVHFRLSGQDMGRPIWYLSAIDPESRQSIVIGVDAHSRQVVRTS